MYIDICCCCCCCCCCYYFICNCGCTMTDEQQHYNYTVITTKMTMKTSIQIVDIENWAIYVDWCFHSCCCCYCAIVLLQQQQNDKLNTCYCVIVFLQKQQNDTWNTTTTRTKISMYIHFLFKINNSILLLLLLFLLLLCNFVVPTTKLHMKNAKSSTTSGHLDICS